MDPAYLFWLGQPLLDADGTVFGTVGDVLVGADDEPIWIEVPSARSGRSILVPVEGLTPTPSGVQVPYSSETLRGAPDLVVGDGPSWHEEDLLRRHYASGSSAGQVSRTDGPAGEASVVRAAEELRLGTQVRPTGTVRVRKWVETSTVSEQVVLHQERLHVEREAVDLTNYDAVSSHASIGEAEYEIVLRDEQVVASKVTVPREVIRVSKDMVEETVLVEADLRHEEVAVETADLADESLAGRS